MSIWIAFALLGLAAGYPGGPFGCPAPQFGTACSAHTDCASCIADPRCGFCGVIPFSDPSVTSTVTALCASQPGQACAATCPPQGCYAGANAVAPDRPWAPCMELIQGPGCCPSYPARFETGNSSIVSLSAGSPVNPSAATIYLKPGSPLVLPITVTSPVTDDLAIDLMLLLDSSGSFKQDLPVFASLVPTLVLEVRKINSDVLFGLSTFVETPLEPFGLQSGATNFEAEGKDNTWSWPTTAIDTSDSVWPTATGQSTNGPGCPGGWAGCNQYADWVCPLAAPPYNNLGGRNPYAGLGSTADGGPINWKYCMESPLSSDFTRLQNRLSALSAGVTLARNNLDYPETSLDGMFYASKCHTGWRPKSRKVLAVVTDARYHGTGPESCQLLATPDQNKGLATCTIPWVATTGTPSNCGAVICTNTGTGPSWVDQGFFEMENDGDCFLQPRTVLTNGAAVKNLLTKLQPDGTLQPDSKSWTYPDQTKRDSFLPGTKESFVHKDLVVSALRSKGIVPLLAVAEDPSKQSLFVTDRQNLWYWKDLVAEWQFGFAEKLERGASGNLVALILAAIADISKSMVLVIENTVQPTSQWDELNYVTAINPPDRGVTSFVNVQPGDVHVFQATFFVPETGTVQNNYVVKFTVLGFGDCFVTVTNNKPCVGCQGDPNGRTDMCGFCYFPGAVTSSANLCVDCAGTIGGNAVVDLCGVCGGDNSRCTDCRGAANQNNASVYRVDACGVCLPANDPLFDQTCRGCDGILKPGGGAARVDVCGVCGGNNGCVACDGEVNGLAFVDDCGVCIKASEIDEKSDTCREASVAVTPGAAAGIAVGIALFVALAVIAAIIIFAKITKNFIDERKFMNAFAAGNSVGTNPLHKEKVGWQENAIAH